jgi:hypothetical protein
MSLFAFQFLNAQSDEDVSFIASPRVGLYIEKHIQFNENFFKVTGYRINIFSENGPSAKAEAYFAKATFDSIYHNIVSYLGFSEPFFKVNVGNWTDRLEATKYLTVIRHRYPNAYVVKSVLNIKDYLQIPRPKLDDIDVEIDIDDFL